MFEISLFYSVSFVSFSFGYLIEWDRGWGLCYKDRKVPDLHAPPRRYINLIVNIL